MKPTENLAQYLRSLFKDFADNRKILEPAWERNKNAYDMNPGGKIDQRLGMGNKTGSDKEKDDWRSKSVSDLSSVKAKAGKVLVCDVLLVGGEVPVRLKENKTLNSIAERILNEVQIPEQAVNDEDNPENSSAAVALMTRLVKEQLIRADADIALKHCVRDAAIYGTGYTRICTEHFTDSAYRPSPDGWREVRMEHPGLKLKHVSVWDIFTDLEDHDLQKNLGIFERHMMSLQDVYSAFSEDDGMNIRDALSELAAARNADVEHNSAQQKDNESPHLRAISKRKKNLEVIEFHGRVPARYIEGLDKEYTGTERDSAVRKDVEIIAVVVENTLVRFAVAENNPRPYVHISWEDPVDDLRGRGIVDMCSPAQQSLDSIIRLIEDNKKVTCNAAFAVKSIFFANKNEKGRFYPGKTIEIDASCDDVRKAIQPLTFPDVAQSGFDLVQLYRESGSEASMIPEIAHGIAPSDATTAYEVSVRNEKAGKYISDVVRGIDDNWIEPVGRFFYNWNMLDPQIPEEFKGSFSVQAMGFASYNDRVLRMNVIKEMISMALSNEMLAQIVDFPALLAEWMKTNDLDAEKYMNQNMAQQNDVLAQFQQAVSEKFQMIEQQFNAIIQELPALSQQSELDAEEKRARIEKLRAESQRIAAQVDLDQQKEKTARAKTIADIEQKNKIANLKLLGGMK